MNIEASKERPILFSGPMVRAILDGRKTQTRRVVTNAQPYEATDEGIDILWATESLRCPYGQPGDRLWVRETWACDEYGRRHQVQGMVYYRADAESMGAWRPSIFMPRWASRITLEVTGVRVERVQDISEADARAEGVSLPPRTVTLYDGIFCNRFRKLWDEINAKRGYGWESNPWVWVVEFKREADDA